MSKTFFATLKKYDIRFGGFLLVFVLLTGISAAAVIYSQLMIGDITEAAYLFDANQLLFLLLILSAVFLARAISSAVSALILQRFSAKAGYTFRQYFSEYFLLQPFASFENVNSGESLSVFSNDLPQAVAFVSTGGLQMIADFMMLVVSVVFIFTISWFYSLIFIALFPVLAIIQAKTAAPIEKQQVDASETIAKFTATINDSLQNLSVLKAYSLEGILEERSFKIYEVYMAKVKKVVRTICILIPMGVLLSILPMLFINAFAARSVINGTMTLAIFVAFVAIARNASEWLMMFAQNLGRVKAQQAGAKRLNDTLVDEIKPLKKPTQIDIKEPLISFEGVSFKYDSMENLVLDTINFEIKQGEKLAFVGPSGSGKSTVLKLLLGLYPQNNGVIKIFGQDISKLDSATIRNCFSYVPQNAFLFPESICENITGKLYSELSKAEINALEKATSDAGIATFINELAQKYDSVLTESADNISGGQKQRIALARALYKDAPIILFDEATSALDSETESQIFEALKHIPKEKTLIMVAHRQSAIDFCDRIIKIEGGQVDGRL